MREAFASRTRLINSAPESVLAGLDELAAADPAAASDLTALWIDALGRAGRMAALEAVFLRGKPLGTRTGLTQAHYIASHYGRLVDAALRFGLGRWWQGHHFYDEGRWGITNTAWGFRWVWRIMFPGYPRLPGVREARGEEVFDFRCVVVDDAKTPGHPVTLLDWCLPDGKMNALVTRAVRPFVRWFVWDLTRSELVGLIDGAIILARIPVRIPFGKKWRTTTFYMHHWL
nr:hypothetical protein [Segniliparus rugosus]